MFQIGEGKMQIANGWIRQIKFVARWQEGTPFQLPGIAYCFS
jgi:hypothetical protein